MNSLPANHKLYTYSHFEDFKRLSFIQSSLAALPKDSQVLDFGCGTGNMSLMLGSMNLRVTGMDIDKQSIDLASRKNTFSHVRFKVIKRSFKLLEGFYDAVVLSEVLEHMERPGIILKQLNSCLKPGGLLIVTVPNGRGAREVLITKPTQRIAGSRYAAHFNGFKHFLGYKSITQHSENLDLTHLHFFSHSQLKSIVGQSGFNLIQFKSADFVSKVFPLSYVANRIPRLQKWDCQIADRIPVRFTGGFYSSWAKNLD